MTPADQAAVASVPCSYCHAHPGERCTSKMMYSPSVVLDYAHQARREAYQLRRNGAAFRREHAA